MWSRNNLKSNKDNYDMIKNFSHWLQDALLIFQMIEIFGLPSQSYEKKQKLIKAIFLSRDLGDSQWGQ